MHKIIIAGSRTFNDYALLKNTLLPYIKDISEIVSGTCSGADKLGEQFAKEFNIPVKQFPADWTHHGKAAGPIRNAEMAKYATACIVFWDGTSRGTKSMIDLAHKQGLRLKVIKY